MYEDELAALQQRYGMTTGGNQSNGGLTSMDRLPMPGDSAGYDYKLDTGVNDGGLFSSLSNSDMIDGIGGIGQLGLGLFNYLSNKKVQKSQIGALNQQVAQSKYAVDTDKKFKSDMSQLSFR